MTYYRLALELLGDAADVLVIEHAGDPRHMFTVAHREHAHDPWASSLRRHFRALQHQVLAWEALPGPWRGLKRLWNSPTFAFQGAVGREARASATMCDAGGQKGSLGHWR